MHSYATTADLRSLKGSLPLQEQQRIVNAAQGRAPRGATFLSYSTADSEFLPGVIRLLEAHGAQVYIDKLDQSLPPRTNRETALALKKRIEEASKFVLFATRRSKASTWIPWELGLADGLKRGASIAILPAVDSAAEIDWPNREYLAIYDRVVFGDLQGYTRKVWMVLDQERNSATELSAWLKG